MHCKVARCGKEGLRTDGIENELLNKYVRKNLFLSMGDCFRNL